MCKWVDVSEENDCVVSFFFFKQKTAYEMLRSLVGSEMCIRDRSTHRRRVEVSERHADIAVRLLGVDDERYLLDGLSHLGRILSRRGIQAYRALLFGDELWDLEVVWFIHPRLWIHGLYRKR